MYTLRLPEWMALEPQLIVCHSNSPPNKRTKSSNSGSECTLLPTITSVHRTSTTARIASTDPAGCIPNVWGGGLELRGGVSNQANPNHLSLVVETPLDA